jgi:short-subunit dehydrogenase
MTVDLAAKAIIVTGASSGIGAATATALARAGADVVLTARRGPRLQALAAELDHFPGRRLVLPGDIGDEAFAAHLIAETIATLGRVDVLINNAAVGHRSPLGEIPAAHAQTLAATNLLGPLYAIQAVLPGMRASGQGQIVNISSVASQRPFLYSGFYCASKAALNTLGRVLQMELRGDNILITTVYPGLTQSEFSQARLGASRERLLPFMEGLPAERVAAVIVDAIRRRKREVYVLRRDWALATVSRIFPRTTDWIVGVGYNFLMNRRHRKEETA